MEVWNTVGQAAIGWLVESVLGSLFTDKLSSWLRRVNLDDDVEELVSEMRNVAVVLEAAKGMKVGDQNEPMAGSLLHLKDLLYDAEDVLDKLDYCRLQEQIIKGNSGDVTSPPTPYFVSITRWFTVTGWKRKREENHTHLDNKKRKREENHTHLDNKIQFSATIKQIAGKLRDACGDVSKGLKINGLKSPEASNLRHQSTARATNATTSYLLEPKVYGRAVEVESIKKLILTNRSKGITVVPIVGNGGMGKTTLAQLVYKDPAVGSQFDVMIWVHVSDKFDMVRVTREILECVSKKQPKEASNFNMLQQDLEEMVRVTREISECVSKKQPKEASNFNMLQQDLEEQMRYKKFLIVLDDVWDVRKDDWKKLLAPLRPNNHVDPSQKEATCKMIIITTRIQSVAESLGTEQLIKLRALEDDDIWSLFKKHAFGNDKHDSNPTLQNLGRIIVKELKGNPLAAKTVGALLGRNLTIDHWSRIIENKEWQSLKRTDDGIMHALKLSYDNLPNQLQQCFSYCSLFPKGYSFSEAQLVQIWIAQGFVEKSSEKLERKGVEYLEELVNSGFFEQVKSMRSSSKDFVMHDLMHDLARMVSKTEYATIEGSEGKELASSIRHLSIVTYSVYHEDKYGKISRNEEFEKRLMKVKSRSKLRSLVLIGQYDSHFFKYFKDAFKEAQHLRLLQITATYADSDSFLSSLVNSTHLRYLKIENKESGGTLPRALSKYYHLQVLDIGLRGFEVPHIPNDINNLVSLRHLVAKKGVCSSIANIGKMTSLQELDNFIIQDLSGFEVTQLKSMNKLVQLGVSRLKNVRTQEEACGAKLKDKQHLEKLHLSWKDAWDGYDSDESYENEYGSYMNIETEGEELSVGDTNGTKSLQHHSNISSELALSKVLDGLEPHHSLKHLRISGYNGATSPTWFPSSLTCLQTLHLEKCGKWQRLPLERLSLLIKLVLIEMGNATVVSIPSLEQLVLIDLPSLNTCSCTSVRNLNSSLKVLKIKNCPALKVFPLFENCQKFEIERTSSWFPHLTKLTIYNCPLSCVHNSLPPSSIVSKLSIGNVSTLPTVEGSSTGTLTIGMDPEYSDDIFDEDSDQLKMLDDKVLSFHNLRFLTVLIICGCQNLVDISLDSLRQLVCLKGLELYNCPKLLSSNVPSELTCEYMPEANHSALRSLEYLYIQKCGITGKWLSLMLQHALALQKLNLDDCKQITGLSIGEEENSQPNLMPAMEDPSSGYPGRDKLLHLPLNLISSLKKLSIAECDDLTFYGSKVGFVGFTSLEELVIWQCPKLLSFLAHNDGNDEQMNGGWFLPLSLGELHIGCVDSPKKLQPCSPGNLTRLKKLRVYGNQSLTSLQLHSCTALQELIILSCESLNYLEGLQLLGNLRLLRTDKCLSGHGEDGRCILPQSLEELYISEYSQKTLQLCFSGNLTRLRKLHVNGNSSYLPAGRKKGNSILTCLQLHSCTTLQELIIENCESLNSLEGLQSLSNLMLLKAHRCLGNHVEDGKYLLPQSLENLYIHQYSQETLQPCFPPNLTCLKILVVSSSASLKYLDLQSCTALESLSIVWCPSLSTLKGLQSLNGLNLLTSLQYLRFWYCHNLVDLPAGLHSLPSLKWLWIRACKNIARLPEMGLPPSLEELYIDDCSEELVQEVQLCRTLASELKVRIDERYVN